MVGGLPLVENQQVKMCDFETFNLIMLRISLSDRVLALHALIYMYILAHRPSGMSITSFGIEIWRQESDIRTMIS